jgi:hypothetical protein
MAYCVAVFGRLVCSPISVRWFWSSNGLLCRSLRSFGVLADIGEVVLELEWPAVSQSSVVQCARRYR